MTNQVIVFVSLFFVYFHISGLATTNILRLTAGCTTQVLESKCYCDRCGSTIPPHLQLPIVSYIACRGKCRNCAAYIPIFPLFLECIILIGMFVITVLLQCTFSAVTLSFLFYELVRVVVVIKEGKRASQFAKQYLVAVLAMVPFYAMTLFVALLYRVVC